MQLADLAFSESEEADLGVPQSLVDSGNIFLIAADAVQSLCNDAIEPAALRIAKECLHTRSITDAAAADGMICIDIDDRAVRLLNALAAKTDLILNRGRGLKVR